MNQNTLGYGLPLRELALVSAAAAVIALLLTNLVRLLALKYGAVAWPRSRDIHSTPTPRWGGLAIYLGILSGLALANQLPALRLAFDYSGELLGIAGGATVVVAVGMLDDRFDLDAITKFSGQVLAAGLMVLGGNQWSEIWLPIGDTAGVDPAWSGNGTVVILGPVQSTIFTVLLTVTVINAVNFIDGLDGLASGIGVIMASSGFVFTLNLIIENGNDPSAYTPALIQIVTVGACFGYLYHAFHPARIFMGDTGSMLIGFMISAGIIGASGRVPPGTESTNYVGLLAPLIVIVGVLFIPVADLLLAIARRMKAGASIFAPDKKHLHHRLLALGHGHRRTVVLLCAWAALLGFASAFVSTGASLLVIAGLILFTVTVLGVLTFLPLSAGYRRRR